MTPYKIHEHMTHPDIYGTQFLGDTWSPWRVIARLLDGDSVLLDAEGLALARDLIGGQQLPSGPVQEFYAIAGRRSGKTRFASVCAVHAVAQDYRDRLAPGEWATVPVVACDRRQAKTLFDYCVADVQGSDLLNEEVSRITASTIEFKHRSRLEVFTNNFRNVRGVTMPLAIIDEAAFLRADDSASPDLELYRAVLPALATLNGRLIVISSPHRKTGLLWTKYRQHFLSAAA